jgi:hypothetical protein
MVNMLFWKHSFVLNFKSYIYPQKVYSINIIISFILFYFLEKVYSVVDSWRKEDLLREIKRRLQIPILLWI